MKVFISWSGKMSHEVACILRDWLPYVIQAVKPFVSSGDIAKGTRWSDVLASELNDTDFGIVCITPYNFDAPWLNFESGALSKAVDRSRVMPFLFRVEFSQLQSRPLSQFQSTTCCKDDVFELVVSIHNRLKPGEQMEEERLRRTFNHWWPELSAGLDKVGIDQNSETETGYGWLYSPGDLARLEAGVDYKKVWVITPSPSQDLSLTCVRDIVRRNVERGVRYSFVMPASDESNGVQRTLRQLFGARDSQLNIHEVSPDLFHSLAVTHYLVIDPDGDLTTPKVFLELPTLQRDFWIEVESEAAFGLIDRFRRMTSNLHKPHEGNGEENHVVKKIRGVAAESVAIVEIDVQ